MDPHQLVLLQSLGRNRTKFSRPPTPEQDDAFAYQRRFEVGLLRILERNLQTADIQSLPSTTAQELRRGLPELLEFLNERANEDFKSGDHNTTFVQGHLKPSGAYPRLERLLPLLDQYPAPFDISGTTSRCIFTIDSERYATAAHALVRNVNRILDKAVLKESKKPSPPSPNVTSSTHDAFDDWLQSFDLDYRELLGKILDAMKSDFEACESSICGTLHKLRIQLLDISSQDTSDPGTTVNIFLHCPGPSIWQGAQCKIDKELQGKFPQKPRLCQHFQSSLELEEGLILLFHEKLDFFSQDSKVLPYKDLNGRPFQNLKELIETQQAFSLPPYGNGKPTVLFKHVERRALAAKLALHLSIFYPWKHTSTPWDEGSIYFLDLSSNNHNRTSPYISWDVRHDSRTAFKPPQVVDDVTLIPSFTALAKLLLEIEYGCMPGPKCKSNFRKRVEEYCEEWKEYGDLSKKQYLEAVDACLGFHRTYKKARLFRLGQTEDPEDTYRRLIRTEIASKIIADLPDFQPPLAKRARSAPLILGDDGPSSDSDGDGVDACKCPEPLVHVEPVSTWHVPPNATTQGASPIAPVLSNGHSAVPGPDLEPIPMPPSAGPMNPDLDQIMKEIIESLSDSSNGHLQDEESDPDSFEARRRRTDKWFNNFIKLLKIYKTGRASGPRLKVAILDSGINLSHPDFDSWDHDRIKETMTFIGGDPKVDNVGHGTHIAATILRLTENVDLFIGKITESKEVEQRQEVADAIKHARTEWKVDMISFSVGFKNVTQPYKIGDEIDLCVHDRVKPILVFASASNDSNEGWRTWPARDLGVICVHSSKERGTNMSDYNPPAEEGYNFSFVGEQLRPSWGRANLKNRTIMKYESGTSYATPVAVSIAALMIGFIRLKGWSNWAWLHPPWTYRGMERIFKLMSIRVDGYDWVSPTRYFEFETIKSIEADLEKRLVCGRQ